MGEFLDRHPQTIRPLTSLRFLAALSVFFYHLEFFTVASPLHRFIGRYFNQGFTGVSFFFILSGFILTHNYRDHFVMGRWTPWREFYVSRLARIYPTHVLFFVLSWPLMGGIFLSAPFKTVVKGISQLFLAQSFFPSATFSQTFNPLSWTISDELFFYALFPLILVLISRLKFKNARGYLGSAFFVWCVAFFIVHVFRKTPIQNWLFYFFPGFRLFDFVLGVLLYHIFLGTKPLLDKKSGLFFTFMETGALGVMVLTFRYASQVPTAYLWAVYFMPSMALLIFVFSFSRGAVSGILSHGGLVLLGEMSYSFYMCHILLLQYVKKAWLALGFEAGDLMAVVVLALVLITSFFSYRYYEMPMKHLIKRKFSGSADKAGS